MAKVYKIKLYFEILGNEQLEFANFSFVFFLFVFLFACICNHATIVQLLLKMESLHKRTKVS